MKSLRSVSFTRSLASLLWLLCSCLAVRAAEPRLALLIGVWDYTDPLFIRLPGIDSDVRKMAAKLEAVGFRVTTVTNPTLGAAKRAVDDFGAALKAAGGVGLFYFSGHGCEHEGQNYLIPRGTRITGRAVLPDEALSAQRVLHSMEAAGNSVNIVFLDACRNGLTKGESGLAAMEAEGTFIGFATASQRGAHASREGSPYTQALLEHLATPGVSITDMHTAVTRAVKLSTASEGKPQVPFQYSGLDRLFYFVPRAPEAAPVPIYKLDKAAPGRLSVKMSRPIYKVGELLELTVSAERDGFVRVVQFGADGSTTQLFPNGFASDHAIRGGIPLELPNGSYKFVTHPPAGQEKIAVFFSEGRFKALPPATRGLPFPDLERGAVLTTRGRITIEAVEQEDRPVEVIGASTTYELKMTNDE